MISRRKRGKSQFYTQEPRVKLRLHDGARLEKQRYGRDVLSNTEKWSWKAMCSDLHGGFHQAVRRIFPEPAYNKDEKVEVVNFSSAISLLAAHEIFLMTKREDLLKQAVERARHISGSVPGGLDCEPASPPFIDALRLSHVLTELCGIGADRENRFVDGRRAMAIYLLSSFDGSPTSSRRAAP